MGVFKNGLKKILPPPVNSFMREVNRIITMEEQNRKLIKQMMEINEEQNEILNQQAEKIEQLEKRIQDISQQLTANANVIKDNLEKQNQTLTKQLSQLERSSKNLSSRIDNTNREISYRYLKGLHPDQYREALEEWYYQKTMTKLDLDNPKTFNEKIQWLKLYDSTPEKTRLADKYLVREWVKEKIGEEYLIPLLGVWSKFDDIDFDTLPDQFVLKANHGSGWNVIVKDKASLNIEATRIKFNNWMKKNFAFCNGLELHYKDIEPKIIAEQYIEAGINGVNDYKFLCFNGNIELIWVDVDRFGEKHFRNIYSPDWELLPVTITYPNNVVLDLKPVAHKKMYELASELSQEFVCARVDFYEVNGKLYFGEITFTSESGYSKFSPNEFNFELGSKMKLPIDR